MAAKDSSESSRVHNICGDCWERAHPDKPAHARGLGKLQRCCFCGEQNSDGIYVWIDCDAYRAHGAICRGVHERQETKGAEEFRLT